MKAKTAMIVWTRSNCPDKNFATLGEVDILDTSKGDFDQNREYQLWYGAGNDQWTKANDFERFQLLIHTFHAMVLYDGVEFDKAHRAFMKIDEYANALQSRERLL